jgi:protein-tyrosine kinase
MDFFYQAIKRAAGLAEAEVEPSLRPSKGINSVSVAPAPASHRRADAVAMLSPERSNAAITKVEVKHPIDHLVAFLSPPIIDVNVAAMEQCRIIRTRLREIVQAKEIRSLMVTSAIQGEGKTTIATNLAFALSQIQNMKILLVDADFRRPYIANFLKITGHRGLDQLLLGKASFENICLKITPSLDVITTASLTEDSAELLHGERMKTFLSEASSRYSLVLLDSPPLFPIVDAQVLAQLVHAAVLVIKAGTTPFDLARQGADLLKPKLIGSILNGVERLPATGYYAQYGNYGGMTKK